MKSSNKYCFFYGGHYSQWFPSEFEEDGIKFKTAEHYMMYMKAMLFNDCESMELILKTNQPSIVKQIGRKIKNFDQDEWDRYKILTVVSGNLSKFSQNPKLRDIITKETRSFVEASPTDKIWGIGLGMSDPKIHDKSQWRGLNLLGYALDNVRDMLIAENYFKNISNIVDNETIKS